MFSLRIRRQTIARQRVTRAIQPIRTPANDPLFRPEWVLRAYEQRLPVRVEGGTREGG